MEATLEKLIRGGRAIVDDSFLDRTAQTDYGSEIRTAYNSRRIGTQDVFVAWIHDSARPADLEYRGQHAFASMEGAPK